MANRPIIIPGTLRPGMKVKRTSTSINIEVGEIIIVKEVWDKYYFLAEGKGTTRYGINFFVMADEDFIEEWQDGN